MNILYVNAGNVGSLGLDNFLCSPPIALMCLTPTVPGHKKYLVDLKAKPVPDEFIHRIMGKGDLVAISALTPSINSALRVAAMAKEHGLPVILGGYHASLVPEIAMEPSIDVAVQNEGELTYPELVHVLETDGKFSPGKLKGIKGISYVDETGALVVNEPRPLIKDLDTLPFPDRTLTGDTTYEYFGASVDLLESSRGCVGRCKFCCVAKHCMGTWRKKTPGRVVAEIGACSRKTRWIGFQDSEFTINMHHVRQICDLIIEHGFDKQWYSAQARADDLVRDPDTFARMVDCGFRMMFLGIESAHQQSLDTIGKNMSTSTIKKAVEMCHDHGVAVMGAIIIGNIGETYEMTLDTIKLATQLEIDIAQFTALTPLPGTPLWDEAETNGWIEDHDWTHYDFTRPVMRTPDLSRQQIAELVHKAYKDFYLGDVWGGYFWKRMPRYVMNKNHWWFFKMLPDFLKNIRHIEKLVTDLTGSTPVIS